MLLNEDVNLKLVSIVIPCYQNAENISDLQQALLILEDELWNKCKLEIILVDDGSTDGGFYKLVELKGVLKSKVKVVQLSGNFGSYNALLAGLSIGSGDCFIQLHADLQDPPEYIPAMIDHWLGGFKFVIGQRVGREDNWLSNVFSNIYHWLIQKLALPDIPRGGYDLILFDKQLKDEIVRLNERNVNMVYLISWLKFPYVTIPLIRKKRLKGVSQWRFTAKIKLFIDSFVAFSYFPIRLVTGFALIFFMAWLAISILGAFKIFSLGFIHWILFTGITFLLFSVAIIAEYLWRTLEAARKRPPFIINNIIE